MNKFMNEIDLRPARPGLGGQDLEGGRALWMRLELEVIKFSMKADSQVARRVQIEYRLYIATFSWEVLQPVCKKENADLLSKDAVTRMTINSSTYASSPSSDSPVRNLNRGFVFDQIRLCLAGVTR